MVISFLGVRTDGQTDTVLNPHMETCQHTKNFNSKLKIIGELSIPTCLPGGRGCIIINSYIRYRKVVIIYLLRKYLLRKFTRYFNTPISLVTVPHGDVRCTGW